VLALGVLTCVVSNHPAAWQNSRGQSIPIGIPMGIDAKSSIPNTTFSIKFGGHGYSYGI